MKKPIIISRPIKTTTTLLTLGIELSAMFNYKHASIIPTNQLCYSLEIEASFLLSNQQSLPTNLKPNIDYFIFKKLQLSHRVLIKKVFPHI